MKVVSWKSCDGEYNYPTDINQEMSCAILPVINCFFEKKNKSF